MSGVIDLALSSSSEEEEVDNIVREPVFEVQPVISAEEVNSIAKAIGEEATQAALKRVSHTPEGVGHSKTRTPRPLKKVCVVVGSVIRVSPF